MKHLTTSYPSDFFGQFSTSCLAVALGTRRWTTEEADHIVRDTELQRMFGETLLAVNALRPKVDLELGTCLDILDTVLPSPDELSTPTTLLNEPSRILIRFHNTDIRVFRHRSLPEHTIVYCDAQQLQDVLRVRCPNLIMNFNDHGFATVPVPIKQVATAIELTKVDGTLLSVEQSQGAKAGR